MVAAAHLMIVFVLCAGAVPILLTARWTWRAPRVSILVWQAVGLAGVMSAIGAVLSAGLSPYDGRILPSLVGLGRDFADGRLPASVHPWHVLLVAGGLLLTIYLAATMLWCAINVLSARRRHRSLLALVARRDPGTPDALVLDHAAAAAYCLPGWHATLVVSAGTLQMLDRDQLAAVLAHERAHGRERHDLVLLPFTALQRAFPRSRLIHEVVATVSLLVEMCADDQAKRQCSTHPLVTALWQFGKSVDMAAPAGALGFTGDPIAIRVNRLIHPAQIHVTLRAGLLAASALVIATPLSVIVG